jgi:hypothetical protein
MSDRLAEKELSLILPSQWDYLLAEVHRVLCEGGHLEMIEEDIIFPILPRRIDAPAQKNLRTRSSTKKSSFIADRLTPCVILLQALGVALQAVLYT